VLRYAALNINLYSEQFENAVYTKSQGAISANQTTAPDGATTADKFTASAGTVNPNLYQAVTTASASVYTFSIYVKKNTHDFVQIVLNGVANGFANFNVANGTVGTVGAGGSATASIINAGSGWYRCVITYTTASTAGNGYINLIGSSTAGRGATFVAAGTESVYLWGQQLEASSTVGTYCPTTSSANSAPRFDHTYDGTSWISKGLLIEEQRTNQATDSGSLSTGWGLVDLTRSSPGTYVAPDGSTGATLFYPSTSGTQRRLYKGVVSTNVISFFAKAAGKRFVYLITAGYADQAFFDLQNKTVTYTPAGKTATIQDVGNGWCRISLYDGGFSYTQIGISDASGSTSVTSNGTDGVLIWGAQAEIGAFPTSYIPTTSASATRSADVCQITGSDFSSFWNASEGSFAVEYDRLSSSTTWSHSSWIFDANNGTANERILVLGNPSGPVEQAYIRDNGGDQVISNIGTAVSGVQQSRLAIGFKLNDFAGTVNGSAVATDLTMTMPSPTKIDIGYASYITSTELNGHIARLRYFNERLTDKQLEDLCRPEDQLKLDLKFSENLSLTPVVGPTPSFSRASTGTYFDSTGTLKYANVNLITYSEQFDNAAWTDKAGSTLYTNAVASPNGDLSADQLQLSNSGYYYQKKAYTTTGTHTFSVWLRSLSPTTTLLRLSNDAGTENSVVTCNVTTSWQRFSVTRNWSANPVNFYAGLDQRSVVGGPGTSTDVYIWGAQLELASSPTQYAKTEASTTAGPRFDHVYSGGQWVSRGLLLEEQRTNLALRSSELSNATWTAFNTTATDNSALSPNGANNASKVMPNTTNAAHYHFQYITVTAASYTVSFYAKAAGYNFVQFSTGLTTGYVNFDLANGLVGNKTAGIVLATSIAPVGSGWYRCSVTFTGSNLTSDFGVSVLNADTASRRPSFAGDGTSGILIYGFQMELGSFQTSHIPTTTTSVVRSADVCQITGTDFSGMWNASEGSVAFQFDLIPPASVTGTGSSPSLISFADPSNNQRFFYDADTTPRTRFYVDDLSTSSSVYVNENVWGQTAQKAAYCYKVNDLASCLNGGTVQTDTSQNLPTGIDRMSIGYNAAYGANGRMNGHIARLRYYAIRLPNRLLIAKSQ
jgi:hypothetical protein